MLKVKLSSVKPGMCLGKPIYTCDGKLLIDQGVSLKESYINKLKALGYFDVYVAWEGSMKQHIDIFLEDTRKEVLILANESMKTFHIAKQKSVEKLRDIIGQLIEDLLLNQSTRIYLTDIRAIDEYTFGHSVNVCVFSLMMGLMLELNKEELLELGIGAILHDIGKITINQAVLNKPAELEPHEFEIIKQHPLNGYNLVKQLEGFSEAACGVIRDHHERFDGSGYPNGLKGKEIHLYSRIVAICDVYDALTSNRVYKHKITPHYAIEYLISMGNHQFDYDLIKVLLKQVNIYPVGTHVRLKSGKACVVVADNAGWPTRPVVEIKENFPKKSYSPQRKIDLTKQLNDSIVSTL